MRNNRNELNCLNCGKKIDSINSRKAFCSAACRSQFKANEKRKTESWYGKLINCKHCGIEFSIIRKSFPEKQFCCHDHAQKYYEKRKIRNGLICEICGRLYCPLNGNWKYCSDDCNPFSEKLGRMKNKKDYSVKCSICGVEFCYISFDYKFGRRGYHGNRGGYNDKYYFCNNECKRRHILNIAKKWRHNRKKKEGKIYECKICKSEFCIIPPAVSKNNVVCGEKCRNINNHQNKLKQTKKRRIKLDNGYIKGLIVQKTGLKFNDIPESLVMVYREYIKLWRILKKGGSKIDEHARNSGSFEQCGAGSSG